MRASTSTTVSAPERGIGEAARDLLVYLLGWPALVLQQDPPAWDRWRWLRSELRHGALRTLDAGSGSGAFTIYAAEKGNVVLGLSLDEAANRRAARRAALLGVRRVGFRKADLRQLDVIAPELGGFDQILCLETIEHLSNDAKLVSDLAGLLRPGGRLFLSTPWAGHRPLVGEKPSRTEDGGQVRWGYTAAELTQLFTAAGLEPVSERYLSGVVSQQLTNLGRRIEPALGRHLAWALTAPLRLLSWLDRPLTRLLRYPWLSIAVVGVKP
jgi:SAM-dependent methyltransferase